MSKFTRGFLGRSKNRDPRLPPGQYDVGSDWPVLTAEQQEKAKQLRSMKGKREKRRIDALERWLQNG